MSINLLTFMLQFLIALRVLFQAKLIHRSKKTAGTVRVTPAAGVSGLTCRPRRVGNRGYISAAPLSGSSGPDDRYFTIGEVLQES